MASEVTASDATSQTSWSDWLEWMRQSTRSGALRLAARIGLDLGLWAWIVIIAGCVHLLVFNALIEWDSHIFLILGKWFPQGIIPYRDAIEVKPPAIFFYLGGLFALFPNAMWVVRFGDFTWTLIGAWGLVRLLRPTTGRFIAAMGATTWMFWQHQNWFNLGGVYTEQYSAVASVAALACTNPIISGLWVATAILFKHPGAAVIVPLLILRWHHWTWRDWGRCAAAIIIPIVAVTVWFAAVGAWEDFLYCNLWVLQYHGKFHNFNFHDRWMKLLFSLWEISAMTPLLVVCVALGVACAFRTMVPLPVAAACWLVVNIAGVLLQANYARHHYTTALPSIVILGATGVAWLVASRATDRLPLKLVRAAAFLGVVWWAWGQMATSYAFYGPHLAKQYQRLWLGPSAWQQGPGRDFEERVGVYLRDHTSPSDRIHMNGWWKPTVLSIYWYADRLPAVQWFYDVPFVLDRARQLEQLQAARPLYVVLGPMGNNPPLVDWVLANYTLETTMEADYKVDIYRRVGS